MNDEDHEDWSAQWNWWRIEAESGFDPCIQNIAEFKLERQNEWEESSQDFLILILSGVHDQKFHFKYV
jgi:hypothetical protein